MGVDMGYSRYKAQHTMQIKQHMCINVPMHMHAACMAADRMEHAWVMISCSIHLACINHYTHSASYCHHDCAAWDCPGGVKGADQVTGYSPFLGVKGEDKPLKYVDQVPAWKKYGAITKVGLVLEDICTLGSTSCAG